MESRASTAAVPSKPPTAHGFDPDFRAQTWKSTVLGKAYQEDRMQKRERKQPGKLEMLITDVQFVPTVVFSKKC